MSALVPQSRFGLTSWYINTHRVIEIAVPMHSLCVGLVDLINIIQSDTQVHSRLPSGATSLLNPLRSRMVTLVPFDRNGKLGILRNKLVAHYDKDFLPSEMRHLDSQTDPTEMGEWIHISLSVLCDLLKLDAYMWTAVGPRPDTSIVMCQEPVMTVFRREEERLVEIEGFYASKMSPRKMVFVHIEKVSKLSQKLFERHSRYRIGGFTPDSPQDWARTLSTT